MIPKYAFLEPPRPRRNYSSFNNNPPYYTNANRKPYIPNQHSQEYNIEHMNYNNTRNFKESSQKETHNKSNNEINNVQETVSSKSYNEFIEIFGIKLYFDDLLILALLFFLYKEEVKDNSLYIILFLLLFS